MKQKVLLSLALLTSISFLQAQNEISIEEFENKVEIKQSKEQHLDDLVITISIKTKETLAEGDIALASLNNTLNFINRVATSQSFRDCVVAKEYKKDVLAQQQRATRMLQEKKLTQEQYNNYLEDKKNALINLNNKIAETCKEEE